MKVPLSSRTGVKAFWLICCALLTAAIVLEARQPPDLRAITARPPGPGATFAAPSFAVDRVLPREDQLQESVRRPIFVVTRKPAPVAALADVPRMQKGQFRLVGVSIAPEGRFAFLRANADGKTVVRKRGEEINGMTVDRVEAERVRLRQGDETEDLVLKVATSAEVAPPSTKTAAPAGGMRPPQPAGGPASSGTSSPGNAPPSSGAVAAGAPPVATQAPNESAESIGHDIAGARLARSRQRQAQGQAPQAAPPKNPQ